MDQENPAVLSKTNVTPALLEEAGSNPTIIRDVARTMYFVQIDALHQRMRDPTVPISQRLAFTEHLSRVGDLVPKNPTGAAAGANGAPGFSVNIVLNQAPAAPPVVTVEAEKPALEATDAEVKT